LVFALYFEVEISENQMDNADFVQNECEKNENYILTVAGVYFPVKIHENDAKTSL